MDYKPSPEWITPDEGGLMRIKCEPVAFPLTEADVEHINKMMAYIDESYAGNAEAHGIRGGIGIAANQIGYRKRMFYVRLDDEQNVERRYFMINPQIVSLSARKAYLGRGEGCLSVPRDRDGYAIRHAKIKIRGFDYLQQKEIVLEAGGLLGVCLQHECDHLDGKLYYDRINPMNPTFADPEWEKV